MVQLNNDWDSILQGEFEKEYYLALREFLKAEYSTRTVYPPMNDIFNALRYTSYADTRLVILGQDPYHGQGQAHGLCFSVREGVKAPPSLVNIFKEIYNEYGECQRSTELTYLAKQGALLLNTTLTVREGAPQSHKGRGWEIFTDHVIQKLDVVFVILDNSTVFIRT